MDAKIAGNERIRELLAAALDGELSDAQAEELAGLDEALIKLVEAPLSRSSRNRLRSSPPP